MGCRARWAVALVHEGAVEERCEGGEVHYGDCAWVDAMEEREGGQDVGSEHRASVRANTLPMCNEVLNFESQYTTF